MNLMGNKKNKLGFTLVELLIVIAIIGILSSVTVVNLKQFKAKARDARRLSDIAQIRKALEIYNYTEGGLYPGTQCTGLTAIGQCLAWISNDDWIPGLDPMPKDPITNTVEGVYYYYLYQVIADNPVNHYLLYYNLETEPPKDECNVVGDFSSAFSCVSVGVQ